MSRLWQVDVAAETSTKYGRPFALVARPTIGNAAIRFSDQAVIKSSGGSVFEKGTEKIKVRASAVTSCTGLVSANVNSAHSRDRSQVDFDEPSKLGAWSRQVQFWLLLPERKECNYRSASDLNLPGDQHHTDPRDLESGRLEMESGLDRESSINQHQSLAEFVQNSEGLMAMRQRVEVARVFHSDSAIDSGGLTAMRQRVEDARIQKV
ncbi:hypothetical protein AC579_7154 [Pseudocercospora musae]|uniref:Uncharacterized protein n=1 Tax=Pseudocercospora musae TaxID=113226 RepID=A0A139GTN0_9PEZI|nr:hypothetical protein AC579_7154 [Pseudocercospora musae]